MQLNYGFDFFLPEAEDLLKDLSKEDREEVDSIVTEKEMEGEKVTLDLVRSALEAVMHIQEEETEQPAVTRTYNLTDHGNALRFADLYNRDVRWCRELGCWLVWNGTHWEPGADEKVRQLAIQSIKAMIPGAEKLENSDERHRRIRHSLNSEKSSRINGMLDLAKAEDCLLIKPEEFDTDPMKINCQNGTLNLKISRLRKHRREDFITRVLPVEYEASTSCTTWEGFLNRIMNGNEDLIEYLQRLLGYCLTGKASEQSMWIFHGSGANGKSTFLETIRALLGEYAKQTDFSTFKKKRYEGTRNDIARIKGARLLTAVETGAGDYLDEVLIKRLTGEDTVTARYLYSEFFEFKNTAKVIIAANHLPRIAGKEHAIWRRVKIVPFKVTIPEEKMAKDLPERLQKELPGILAWALQGCRFWLKGGLRTPAEVADATAAYQAEMNSVATFVEERCQQGPKHQVVTSELWDAYEEWCFGKKIKSVRKRAFKPELLGMGFGTKKSGREYYSGLSLTTTPVPVSEGCRMSSSGRDEEEDS